METYVIISFAVSFKPILMLLKQAHTLIWTIAFFPLPPQQTSRTSKVHSQKYESSLLLDYFRLLLWHIHMGEGKEYDI